MKPTIDLDPRKHSHLYELRPMSPWLLVPVGSLLVVGILLNGPTNPVTWGLVVFAGAFFSLLPMVFPRQLLSRPKD